MTERELITMITAGELSSRVQSDAFPRLRFDRVALRVVRDLKQDLSDTVPEGHTLLVTISAPIRVPARTVRALTALLREFLARGLNSRTLDEEVCGNRVSARLVKTEFRSEPSMMAFVCNPQPTPHALLNAAAALLESGSAVC